MGVANNMRPLSWGHKRKRSKTYTKPFYVRPYEVLQVRANRVSTVHDRMIEIFLWSGVICSFEQTPHHALHYIQRDRVGVLNADIIYYYAMPGVGATKKYPFLSEITFVWSLSIITFRLENLFRLINSIKRNQFSSQKVIFGSKCFVYSFFDGYIFIGNRFQLS